MSRVFHYQTRVPPAWIDYNGHMQDAYYGLAYSWAVDALQDEIGFDRAYRALTGCSIYALEDHRVYLREAFEGDMIGIETRVLAIADTRFHLHMSMSRDGALLSVGEVIEGHVVKEPKPHLSPMPARQRARLEAAKATAADVSALERRAGALSL